MSMLVRGTVFNLHAVLTKASLSSLPEGYRHVYLEGMEEASIFVHIAVNEITGKVGAHRGTRRPLHLPELLQVSMHRTYSWRRTLNKNFVPFRTEWPLVIVCNQMI